MRSTGLTLILAVALIAASTLPSPASAAPRCFGKRATIVGTKHDDHLVGTPRRDVIVARAGSDEVRARGGNDRICTTDRQGDYFDFVHGGGGADRVRAHDGQMWGDAGDDLLIGGTGADDYARYETARRGVTVNLDTGKATGQGHDRLRRITNVKGSDHADVLVGDDTENSLAGNRGRDAIYGGVGDDVIGGGPGNDDLAAGLLLGLNGGPGDDSIFGYAGSDYLYGGTGDDVLGGDGSDRNYAGFDTGDGGEGAEAFGDSCFDLEAVSNCEYFP